MSEQAATTAPTTGEPKQQEQTQQPNTLGASAPPPPASWIDGLPDDLKGEASLSKFKDVAGLAKSYTEMQKMMGKPKLEAPQENWQEGQWNELFDKLGRPKAPSDYKFELPEGLTKDEAAEKQWAEIMHKTGLTQKQAQALHGAFVQQQIGQLKSSQESRQAQIKAGEEALRQEWGDKFGINADNAFRAAKEFGGKELAQVLDQYGLGNHPTLVKMFAKIGSFMLEGGNGGRVESIAFNKSAGQAEAEIANLKMDKQFMEVFMDRSKAGHKEAVARWNKLHEVAFA